MEQNLVLWQVLITSAVPLMVAVVGIISTCLAAKASAKSEMQKAIVLRFVDMFETAQGLSTISDVYANLLVLFSTSMSKEALALRVQTIILLGQGFQEAAKTADSAVLRLNVYFPDPKYEVINLEPSMSSLLKLFSWIIELDNRMRQEGRTTISDEEYKYYQALEQIASNSVAPLHSYYNERRKYFNRCYAIWRKKNLSFLKWK